MTQQVINGTDTLNTGRTKINANFTELYGSITGFVSADSLGISTSNTAAQNRSALLSLANTNQRVYFPPGDYSVDNAAGKIQLGAFSGVWDFAPGARLVFTDRSKGGIVFGAGTRPIINNLSLKYATTPSVRVDGQHVLGFTQTIQPILSNYRCDGSPSLGVAFELCQRPRVIHAYITNTMADGCMFSNCADSHVTDYIAEDTGDDGLSFVNHNTGADNRGGYASGFLIRRAKARGLAISGAKDITVENFWIEGTDGDGIVVAEDRTYGTRTPEGISIRNGTILGAGTITGLGLTAESGINFNVFAGRNTIENVQIEDCVDNGVYVALGVAGSHMNISNVTTKDSGASGFFVQINPSVHIENCRAITSNGTGINLLANYRLTFRDLTAINCSLTNVNRRGVAIGQVNYGGNTYTTAYVDGDGLQLYDDQATPTGYRVFLEGITGFALTGDIGTIRSFCRTALPNYVVSTSGANMSVTRNTVHSGSQSSGGTAAPTGGFWRVGEVVTHTAPAAGGNIGWVCTKEGNPGTWKTFGTIAA